MRYPHSPDVHEREHVDDGFSMGWGAHHQPSEKYWIDCHAHIRETDTDVVNELINRWTDRLDAWRLRRTIGLDGSPDNADDFGTAARENDRFRWLLWPGPNEPDLDDLDTCLDAGASGLKLHNRPVIEEAIDPTVWHSEAWYRIFERLDEVDLPVLWHVTQRHTDAPYTGGGRYSYWETGWENGAEFTNEDLLQAFLSVVEDHPGIDFVGAHQLHIGFDRLAGLFAQYPNLYVDTSIGCFVRWGDEIPPTDRERAREFFLNWSERILFGTDCILSRDLMGEYLYQQFLGHVRYIRQLNLPYDPLQQVSHRNAERLFGLKHLDTPQKGALRP
jgi:predicted TIM-barrel fold metal-dependent hydrolase